MKEKIDKLDYQQRGKLGLVGGFLIHTVLGSMYIWANLCEYVTAYFVQQQKQDITNKEVNVIFPIMLLSFPLGLSYGTVLAKKYGAQKVAFTFSSIISVSIILCSFATKFWVFALFYAMCAGLSMGFIYMIPLDNAQKYFPNRKGTVYGIIICGYGLGSLIFNWILYYLINPNNIKAIWNEDHNEFLYPQEVSANLPSTLVCLGFIYFIFSSIGSYLIIEPTEKDLLEVRTSIISLQSLHQFGQKTQEVIVQQKNNINEYQDENNQQRQQNINSNDQQKKKLQFQENEDGQQNRMNNDNSDQNVNENQNENNNSNNENQKAVITTWQESQSNQVENKEQKRLEKELMANDECGSVEVAIKQKELYVSLVIACIGVIFGLIIATNYKVYGLTYHNNDKYFYLISTASSLSNGLSRLVWGYLMDKMKFKRLLILNLSIQIILDVTISSVAPNQFIYAFYIFISFFCYGGWYVIMPAHCYRLFGSAIAPRVYFILSLGFPLSAVIQQILVKNLSWNNVFLIVFGLQAFGLILVSISSLSINWREKAFIQTIQSSIQPLNVPPQLTAVTEMMKGTSPSENQQHKNAHKLNTKKDYYMMDYEL